MKTAPTERLILGLGNDILTDDSVGLRVAAVIRERLGDRPGVTVLQSSEMGLSLLDLIAGFEELVIIDAVQTGKAQPGFVHEVDDTALQAGAPLSPHFLGIGEVLALGRKLGLLMPGRVKIFAIEVADAHTVGTDLSPVLAEKFPALLAGILAALEANPNSCAPG